MAKKKIEYPKDGSTIGAPIFPAYGFAPSNKKKVRVALIHNGNSAGSITLLQRADHDDEGFWCWLISGVQNGQSYTLELRRGDDDTDVIDSVSFNVTLAQATGITYPPNNQTVTPSFTAYGTTDKPTITAKMSRPGSSTVSQAATISNGTWHAIFYSLSAANNWTLTADDGGASPPTSSPITVSP
jgi:hypothetical protein